MDAPRAQTLETFVQRRQCLQSQQQPSPPLGRANCATLFSALDAKLHHASCWTRVDPGLVLADAQGQLRLVNYRLSRCLQPEPWSPSSVRVRRTVQSTTKRSPILLAFLVTTRKPGWTASVRAVNPKMAAPWLQRCRRFSNTPGLSFQEIKRSLLQAVPEEVAVPKSKAALAQNIWSGLRSIPLRLYLAAVTVIAILVVIVRTIIFIPPSFYFGSEGGAYVIDGGDSLFAIDGSSKHRFSLPFIAGRPDMVGALAAANGKVLVVCDRASKSLRVYDATNHLYV